MQSRMLMYNGGVISLPLRKGHFDKDLTQFSSEKLCKKSIRKVLKHLAKCKF